MAASDYITLGFQLLVGRSPSEAERRHFEQYFGTSEDRLADFATELMSYPDFRVRHAKELLPFDSSLSLRTVNGCEMIMPVRDWVYDTRAESVTYEPWVANAITSRLNEGCVFVDIGANVGVHSVLASTRVGPSGRVLAVEALPANAAILMKTITNVGYSNIIVCSVALSDKVNVEWLTNQVRGSNQNLNRKQDAPVRSGGRRAPVLTLYGDLLFDWLDRLDLVKIDVEGHERSVLRGMRLTLERFRPDVIAEFHPHLAESDFVDLLFELGYDARLLHLDGTLGQATTAFAELREQTHLQNAGTAVTHSDLLFRMPR